MSRLYRRLLLWFCAVNVVTLLVSVVVTNGIAWYSYGRTPDWPALAQAADARYISGGSKGLADWAIERRADVRIEATLFENGKSLLGGPLLPELENHLPQLLAAESIVLRPAPHLLLIGQRVVGADGVARQLIALRGARPFHLRRETLLAVQIILSLLAIGAASWWIARSIARPLAALQQAAQGMSAGDLGVRVGAPHAQASDELGLLAREFDRMAERVETLVANERRMLRDVSHELRSPLTRLQLILELARREKGDAAPLFARAEREVERLDQLIGELLQLSRVEADLSLRHEEPIELDALLRDRVAQAELDAQAGGSALRLATVEPVTIAGDARLLARAVDNLLSNAIKFGAGREVLIALRRDRDVCELSIRDHGPGVSADELPKLFRPFFRGSNAVRTEGFGLGLAIVERVARVHGATLLASTPDGGGLCVTLSLPLKQ